MPTWKRDFGSGLIVLAPLIVVALVVRWIYRHIAAFPLVGALEPAWLPGALVPLYRVVIAVGVFAMLVLGVGYFMRTTLGRFAESQIDEFINRIPALRVVYNASKLAVETALSSGTDDLQSPVYLETWPGIRMTAFRTGKKTRDGKLVLFMPTAPNITSGYVIEVEPERVEETNERVEEALTRILSAGFADSAHQIPVADERRVGDVGARAGTSPGSSGSGSTDPTDSTGSTGSAESPGAGSTGSASEAGNDD